MSKRKAVVNDIIYELDNEDLETSSEDEKKDSKKTRIEEVEAPPIIINDSLNDVNSVEVVDVDSSDDAISVVSPSTNIQNGGKICSEVTQVECSPVVATKENDTDIVKNISLNESIAPNEDLIVDSPDSDSQSNIVIGCENRSPLVTVMFKNKKIAKDYKQKIKEFMLKLIKLHDEENLTGSESETDLELDIWPEDLKTDVDVDVEDVEKLEEDEAEDNLFFIDTAPGVENNPDVPSYSQVNSILANAEVKEPSPPPVLRRVPTCFNCDGAHQLRECTLPKNNVRITEKRNAMLANRVGRYHVEDDQKFGHLVPGRISGRLRHAMGLKRDEIPAYIYRMRMLGYPPGWLEDARISHSGITMFDSTGKAILDPEEEDGEVCEPGSKDKFDIKKILDFPGFNVPASSRYTEEAHRYGLPPISDQDSKMNMLQVLAPNAMKAYKRKRLTFFPSATDSPNSSLNVTAGHAEMDLDDDDEIPEFPSVPPLPDDVPPPPPPPPDSPPPLPPGEEPPLPPGEEPPLPPGEQPPLPPLPLADVQTPSSDDKTTDPAHKEKQPNDKIPDDDIDIQLSDIPMPESDEGVVSSDDEKVSSGRNSPSLADLEEKKRLLLAALEGKSPASSPSTKAIEKSDPETIDTTPNKIIPDTSLSNETPKEYTSSDTEAPHTPQTGHVKMTSYGTPVMNIASPYAKLPTDDKFAKDICDVINFENLPDSTGKYVKISNLLKRVKSEVDRIQDS